MFVCCVEWLGVRVLCGWIGVRVLCVEGRCLCVMWRG